MILLATSLPTMAMASFLKREKDRGVPSATIAWIKCFDFAGLIGLWRIPMVVIGLELCYLNSG